MEVDGFGPHWRDISRRQFADKWVRQNHLVLDGWTVLRFAYDDIVERPRQCQQMIQQLLGLAMGDPLGGKVDGQAGGLMPLEREVLRCMQQQAKPFITPGDVRREFGVCAETAYRSLHRLVAAGKLTPVGRGTKLIRKYRFWSLFHVSALHTERASADTR